MKKKRRFRLEAYDEVEDIWMLKEHRFWWFWRFMSCGRKVVLQNWIDAQCRREGEANMEKRRKYTREDRPSRAKVQRINKSKVCKGCGGPALPAHECPWGVEIRGDHEPCYCCDVCTQQCAMDI